VKGKWRPWPESVRCQEPVDGGLGECGLDPAHGPTTTRAGVQIGAEHMRQKPGPPVACGESGVVLSGVVVAGAAEGGKAELVAGGRGRPSLCGIDRHSGHDLSPQSGVAREDAKIPQ